MFDVKKVEMQWGGETLTLETGRIARQADGAVLATLGETVVLCAVTAAKSVREGQDFFPLTVHYQEKFSAAGRIPGGFFASFLCTSKERESAAGPKPGTDGGGSDSSAASSWVGSAPAIVAPRQLHRASCHAGGETSNVTQ